MMIVLMINPITFTFYLLSPTVDIEDEDYDHRDNTNDNSYPFKDEIIVLQLKLNLYRHLRYYIKLFMNWIKMKIQTSYVFVSCNIRLTIFMYNLKTRINKFLDKVSLLFLYRLLLLLLSSSLSSSSSHHQHHHHHHHHCRHNSS